VSTFALSSAEFRANQRTPVRLLAGRSELSDALQTLCFMAGANSIFYGGKLLSTGSPDTAHDQNVFERLMTAVEFLKTVEFTAAAPALSTLTA